MQQLVGIAQKLNNIKHAKRFYQNKEIQVQTSNKLLSKITMLFGPRWGFLDTLSPWRHTHHLKRNLKEVINNKPSCKGDKKTPFVVPLFG